MRLLSIQSGDTITAADTLVEAVAANPEIDINADTMDFKNPPDSDEVSGRDVVDAHNALTDMRTQHRAGNNPNNPLDFEQRLDLALSDSERASNDASDAVRVVNNLSKHVQDGFADIGSRLDKIHRGEPFEEPVYEPGSSVFDD